MNYVGLVGIWSDYTVILSICLAQGTRGACALPQLTARPGGAFAESRSRPCPSCSALLTRHRQVSEFTEHRGALTSSSSVSVTACCFSHVLKSPCSFLGAISPEGEKLSTLSEAF